MRGSTQQRAGRLDLGHRTLPRAAARPGHPGTTQDRGPRPRRRPRDGERSVLNPDATLAAQEKAAELAERFAAWAWEDPARAEDLARTYNERFNNLVLRSYDSAQLTLPGLSLAFRPRPHQVAAVARMIHEPAVLLAHEVGAGKTAEMIIGVTELRRLGLVRKPAIVVPNHMLEQFAREWLQLYPQSRVLVARRERPPR